MHFRKRFTTLLAGVTALLAQTGLLATELQFEYAAQSLTVTGAISSPANREILGQTAASLFPATKVSFDVDVASGLPPTWSLITDQTLRALEYSYSATATISESVIVIRGATNEPEAMRATLDRLRTFLPANMQLQSNVAAMASTQSFESMCRQLFAAALEERSIVFAERSIQLSTSAFGLLDALAELSHDCPAAHVTVTGSGDGGDSTAITGRHRADSVVAYLSGRGMHRDRLSARGSADQTDRRIRFQIRF